MTAKVFRFVLYVGLFTLGFYLFQHIEEQINKYTFAMIVSIFVNWLDTFLREVFQNLGWEN